MQKLVSSAALAITLLSGARASALEPWSDPDPPAKPTRHALGEYGFRGGAEYRANWLYVNPISLNTVSNRRTSWIEHRLRLDGTIDFKDKVRIITSVDALDGVLWGDNGTLGVAPESDRGTNVAARNPNVTQPCIQYLAGDALDPNAYGYGLCSADPVRVRRLYGEVMTPIGALRIGRQPTNEGMGVQAATGDGRMNRFGFARQGNSTDRILFATKPLEGFKPKDRRNRSETEGFFFVLAYDRVVDDSVRLFSDNVQGAVVAMRYLDPKFSFGRDLELTGYFSHRWDQQFGSDINSIGLRAFSRFGSWHAGVEGAANLGTTREVSESYKVVTNDPVVDQTVRQLGGRAVIRYDRPTWTAYLEADYASGDPDPNARTPLTQFVFAEDTNVGLLLFEHVLAFQSARAAAAGAEALRRLGAPSYPSETVRTRGSYTNAIAIFPQGDFRPHKDILLRGGVLVAWADVPVNDPGQSLQNRDGITIEDDLVNYVGGKPARYYGTELDGRFQWRFEDHFIFDLEGAILFPGDALKDADGNAVRSVLVQGRSTFVF